MGENLYYWWDGSPLFQGVQHDNQDNDKSASGELSCYRENQVFKS